MPAAYVDISNLAKDLSLAGQRVDLAIAGAIRTAALAIQHEAQQDAPKKTGTLASSIQVNFVGPLTAVIGPTVYYGVYQEFGTRGPYVIKPRKPDGRLVFQVNGTTVFAKQVTHPGLHARPYMRPAAQDVVGNLVQKVGGVGVQMVMEPNVND